MWQKVTPARHGAPHGLRIETIRPFALRWVGEVTRVERCPSKATLPIFSLQRRRGQSDDGEEGCELRTAYMYLA